MLILYDRCGLKCLKPTSARESGVGARCPAVKRHNKINKAFAMPHAAVAAFLFEPTEQ